MIDFSEYPLVETEWLAEHLSDSNLRIQPLDNHIDTTLAALADPNRRHVIELLREHPRRAGELAAACALSSPAMSRHLRVLRASGLIEVEEEQVEQDARLRVYRLRSEPFIALQAWLDQMQAFWTEQLGSFKTYVERTQKGEHI